MARIPTAAELGFNDPRSGTPAVQYPTTDPEAAALGVAGQGLQQLGGAALHAADAQEEKRQKLNAANSTIGLVNELIPLHTQMQTETDPEKLGAIQNQMKGLLEKYSQGIDDPATRAAWLSTHSNAVLAAVSDVDKRYTSLDRERVAAGLIEQMDTASRVAASSGDPDAIAAAAVSIRDIAKYGEEYGALKPGSGYIAQRQQLDKMVRGGADNLINQGRVDQAQALLDRHSGDIDPVAAEVLRRRITAAKEKAGIRADIDAEWGGSDKGYAGARAGSAAGGGAVEQFLDLAETKESGGRNIEQQVVGPSGGYNPSVGRVTGPSSASGNFQITDTTWKEFAPQAGIDIDKYPRAISAPYDVQRQVARTIATTSGVQHWTDYNKELRTAAASQGLPVSGPIQATSSAPTPGQAEPTVAILGADQKFRNLTNEQADQYYKLDEGEPQQQFLEQIGKGQPAPAANAAQPQFDGGTDPLPDIAAMTARIQERADRGDISQTHANAVITGLHGRYNVLQSEQAGQRATLLKQLNDGAAMLEDGRDFSYDPAQIRHFFPKEKADEFIQRLDDAKDGGQIVSGLRTASPDQLVQQREQLAAGLNDPNATNYAKRRRMLDLFDKGIAAHYKSLGDDPAGYVAQYSPTIAPKFAAIDGQKPETFFDYATASLAEQARLGVPEEMRSVLPKMVASQVASRIAAIDPTKQNPGEALAATAQSYGAYWPQVFGDLVKAKLPGTYQVLATMDRPEQGVAAADLSRAIGLVAEKGGMSVMKKAIPDETQKAIDKGLDTALTDFRESTGYQSGGPRLYATVRDAAQALAYYYGFRGKSDSEAVQAAVDGILNTKYDFGHIGGATVRVPKGTLDVVDAAAAAVQQNVKPDDLGPVPGNSLLTPDQRKDIWLSAIRNGSWINNEDDSGLVLMGMFRNGDRSAVRRADGSRIEVKFADAPAIATANPAPSVGSIPAPAAPYAVVQ